jgi:WD40 repeat protein
MRSRPASGLGGWGRSIARAIQTLLAQSYDPLKQSLAGNPYPVAEQVALTLGGAGGLGGVAVSASSTGSVVYRVGSANVRQLVWMDRSGKELGRVGPPADLYVNPSMSPDGRRVVLQRTVNGNPDIWLLDLARGVLTRFTSHPALDANPIWSPDGSRIVFTSNRDGPVDLYQKLVSGDGGEERLTSMPQTRTSNDWSPDGATILYRVTDSKLGYDIWALPTSGEGKPFPVVQTPFNERDAQFSPDGKWIAYQSNESGRFEIYIQPFPGSAGKELISTSGGGQPRWRRDGKELFYVGLDGQLMAVSIQMGSDGRTVEAGRPVPLFPAHVGAPVPVLDRQQYIVSADGQRFLMNRVSDEAGASPITVILNWKPRP